MGTKTRLHEGNNWHKGEHVHVGSTYSPEELEFLKAVQEFMKKNNIRFMSIIDYLLVAKSIGYVRGEIKEPVLACNAECDCVTCHKRAQRRLSRGGNMLQLIGQAKLNQ